MDYSLTALYAVAGITKQAVWDHFRREQATLTMIRALIGRVDARRAVHPGEGLEKLYWQLRPDGLGRDKFCAIFMGLGYGLDRPKNPVRTTIPAGKVFANLIDGRVVSGPCQVWQSDITYIRVGARFYYLTFIIDVYTRRIVGYAVSDDLRAGANLRALTMALALYGTQSLRGCTHHSDRGSQYTDGRYLALLRRAGMAISMGRTATDNAFAERINGVIKNEYLIPRAPGTLRELKRYSKQAVADYNTTRHHGALGRRSPDEYERDHRALPEGCQKIEVIRSENTPLFLEGTLQREHIDTTPEYPYCSFNLN